MPLTVGPGSITVALTLGANPPPGFRALLMTSVVMRLWAFILLCIGVQICWNGVHALVANSFGAIAS